MKKETRSDTSSLQQKGERHGKMKIPKTAFHLSETVVNEDNSGLVTERTKAEKELRASEEWNKLILQTVLSGVIVIDVKTRMIVQVNETAIRMIGLPEEQVIGHKCHNFICPQDEKNCPILDLGNKVDSSERILLTANGSKKNIIKTASPVKLHDRDYLIESFVDITDRKRAESVREMLLEIMQGLVETQDLKEYLRLVHHSIGKVIYAENFFVILYNKATELFEEVYSVDKFDPPAHPSQLENSISAYVFRTGQPLLLTQEKFDELNAQGVLKLIGSNSPSWLGVPLKTSGETIGVMVVQDYDHMNRYMERDTEFLVSIAGQIALSVERKLAADALKESEQRQRFILESLPVAIYSSPVDPDFDTTWISGDVKKITGFEVDEYLSEVNFWRNRLHPEDKEGVLGTYQKTPFTKEKILEYRWKCKDEQYYWFLDRSVLLENENQKEYLGVIVDITERKRVEEELIKTKEILEESENKFKTIIQSQGEGIGFVDQNERFEFANLAAGKIFETDADELIGASLYDFLSEDEILKTNQQTRKRKRGITETYEQQIVTKKGNIKFLNINATPKIDENNNYLGAYAVFGDITKRKIAEQAVKEYEKQLIKLNSDKDRFMSILAHDLKSPFSTLLGLSGLVLKNVRKYNIEEIENIINLIHKSTQNTYNLLEDLLMWARSQSGKLLYNPQQLNFSDICQNIISDNLLTAANKSITINCAINDSLIVFADNDMVKTVLRNLISNAIKFTDNGVGIEPAVLHKLFDISQMYTSKGTANESGTGLGLLLCKEFIDKHNGKIWVESELGKGSDFKFSLPCEP